MKKRKVRVMLGYLIAIMPTSKLRIFLYRRIFGYRIFRSRIGWKTVIVVDDAELNDCLIGRNNQFLGPMKIKIKQGANINHSNTFQCGWWSQAEQFDSKNYDQYLEIGENTLITSEHHFDVVGAFVLGDSSWIAGLGLNSGPMVQMYVSAIYALESIVILGVPLDLRQDLQ